MDVDTAAKSVFAGRAARRGRWFPGVLAVATWLAAAAAAQPPAGPPRGAAAPSPIPSPSAAAPAVVRAYPVALSQLDAVAAELERRYARRLDVRVAMDRRTGQLLVAAPEAVQQDVARWLEQRRPAPSSSAQPDAAGQPVVYQLRQLSAAQLESILRRLWDGAQLTTTPDGHVAAIRLDRDAPVPTVLELDYQRNRVALTGPDAIRRVLLHVLQIVDQPSGARGAARLVRLERADPATIEQALAVVRSAAAKQQPGETTAAVRLAGAAEPANPAGAFVARIFQAAEAPAAAPGTSAAPPPAGQPSAPPSAGPAPGGGVFGEVQLEYVPELNVIIIRGRPEDVQRVEELIREIERQSAVTRPEIEVHVLQHVNGEALAELITPIYEQVFQPRQGPLSITPLVKPNALLLIGQRENIDSVKELIEKLDQPVRPDAKVKVYPLRYMSAVDAEERVNTFFADPTGLNTRVRVAADYRSNSLIIEADPRDLEQVEQLLKQLDVESIAAKVQLRVFPLKNTLAADLQTVLEQAIGAAAPAGEAQNTLPSTQVEIVGVDDRGKRVVESGVLADVTVTADENLNALIVRAPAKSMQLIEELIKQLDNVPAAEAQIKVFQIQYGDATTLAAMLQQLFGQQVTVGAQGTLTAFGQALGFAGPAGATAAAGGESSLIPLRFAVDQRTNSIVASGSRGDLAIVEAILVRLDEGDLRRRKTAVYRLNNAPAQNVATALTNILTRETQLLQQQQQQLFALITPFEFIEQQVFVEPEAVSNSLIISATPEYFDQIVQVVEELDRRPPMVVVNVVIAEVTLDDAKELGVELGIQDSLLFDRGISAAGLDPGFDFVNAALGNSNSSESLATRELLGGQAFSSFLVGRSSAGSQFPGIVLSASNESISILIRALQSKRRVQILSRPTIMALNNFPASVLVGERVPRVTDISQTNQGTVSSTTLDDVGLSLGVIPRVTPDGLIVMDLEVTKSAVGAVEEGIPIGVQDGVPINSPKFTDTTAITTISARSGQTVVFAGLITHDKSHTTRGVPFVSDIPVLGRLFRFDTDRFERKELLIFLTPYIVDDEADVAAVNLRESERMSWCLADVVQLAGDVGLAGGRDIWSAEQAPVIFPDQAPTAAELPPPAAPVQPEPTAPPGGPLFQPPEGLEQSKPYFEPGQKESKPYFEPQGAAAPPGSGAAWTPPPPPLPAAPAAGPPAAEGPPQQPPPPTVRPVAYGQPRYRLSRLPPLP